MLVDELWAHVGAYEVAEQLFLQAAWPFLSLALIKLLDVRLKALLRLGSDCTHDCHRDHLILAVQFSQLSDHLLN